MHWKPRWNRCEGLGAHHGRGARAEARTFRNAGCAGGVGDGGGGAWAGWVMCARLPAADALDVLQADHPHIWPLPQRRQREPLRAPDHLHPLRCASAVVGAGNDHWSGVDGMEHADASAGGDQMAGIRRSRRGVEGRETCVRWVGRAGQLRTTAVIVGQEGRTFISVGSKGAATATATSSAWPQMYWTESGPRVSYKGTAIMEYACSARSTSIQSAVLTPKRPTALPDGMLKDKRPDPIALRRSAHCAYDCHVYVPYPPDLVRVRVPR